jgi:hypothetical protein
MTTVPLLALGVHPVVAYNLALVASFVASGWTMYILAERLTGSPAAAFISGLLFGFYPYRFEHYSHFELQMTYCIPLALLMLHRMVTSGGIKNAVWLGLLAAAQLYSSMYYAVFFAFYAAIAFAVSWCLERPPVRRLVAPSIVAAVLALVLAWPLVHVYSAAKLGDRDLPAVGYYSARVSDFFRAHDRSALWGDRMLSGRQPERALFPGVMILVLGAIALVPPLGKTRLVHAAAGFTLFEISLGLNGFIYTYLYEGFGFVRGLRVPARASIFVGMALALLSGFAVRRMLAARPRWTPAIVAALTILIGIDLHPLLKLEPVWPEPPPIYGAVAGSHGVVLAEFPYGGSRRFTSNVPFMYFSLWHWADMVNGYSGHIPEGQEEFEKGILGFPDAQSLELVRSRGATHVTVNCAFYRGGCDELLKRIEGIPELHLVASGRWQGQPVQLYELRR